MSVYNRIYNKEDWDSVNTENMDIMQDFLLEYKSQKKKPSTLVQYENDLRIVLIYILKFCKNRSILTLSKKDFRNFSLWLTETLGVSNARANRLMSCCRSLLTFVENEDEYEYEINQAAKVKGLPKEVVREIVFLDNDIILKLCNKFLAEERYKEATLLALAYDSAGRKTELSQVEKESFFKPEVSFTNKVVGKRGKVFNLIYFSLTKKCAKLYLEQRGPDDIPQLFIVGEKEQKRAASRERLYDWVVSWRKDIKELTGKEYGINVHSLRHIALDQMSQGTHYICSESKSGPIPIEKLRLVGHHESVATTEGYLMDRSDEQLEQLFNIKLSEEEK